MTWSSSGMPRGWRALRSRSVSRMSASLGTGGPVGWLWVRMTAEACFSMSFWRIWRMSMTVCSLLPEEIISRPISRPERLSISSQHSSWLSILKRDSIRRHTRSGLVSGRMSAPAASSNRRRPSSRAAVIVRARTWPIPFCCARREGDMDAILPSWPSAWTSSSWATSTAFFPPTPLPISIESSSATERDFAPRSAIFSRGRSCAHSSFIFISRQFFDEDKGGKGKTAQPGCRLHGLTP